MFWPGQQQLPHMVQRAACLRLNSSAVIQTCHDEVAQGRQLFHHLRYDHRSQTQPGQRAEGCQTVGQLSLSGHLLGPAVVGVDVQHLEVLQHSNGRRHHRYLRARSRRKILERNAAYTPFDRGEE